MVGGPRLLLLDEPTSALDPAGRRTVRALLEELRGRGVAVLLNSHLLSEVELVCDRVAIIARGEVVAAGTPAELPRRRGRGRDGGGHARWSGRDAARTRRAIVASSSRPARRSTGCACCAPRSRTPTWRRSGDDVSGASRIIAAFALREALRRRVFLVVALLTLAFLALYGLGVWQAFKISTTSAAASAGSTRTPSPARRCSAWPCSGRCSSAPSWPSSSRSARSAATPSAGCCSRCSCGRCARRTVLLGRLLAAGGGQRRATSSPCTSAMRRSPGVRRLVAGQRRRARARSWRSACASSPRCRSPARCCWRRPPTASPSSWPSARASTAGLLGQIGEALNSDTLTDVADIAS